MLLHLQRRLYDQGGLPAEGISRHARDQLIGVDVCTA
jgi:hypothetical protein